MRVIFGLTVLGGIGLLALAFWPGYLENVVLGIPGVLLALPLLGIWFLLLVALALRDIVKRPEAGAPRRWLGVASAGVMFCTIGLLSFDVPQRVGLAICHARFQRLAEAVPPVGFRGRDREINLRVGPYRVDRFAADERGGVFFRTATGPDGIGPDRMSYGFAWRPNREGTPFGRARYELVHLFGGWYSFQASDDYY
jgi:hypothetical protein